MEPSEVLGRIGVVGFVAIFQLVGVGAACAAISSRRDARRKAPLSKELPGIVGACLFGALFAVAPVFMTYGFCGWPGLVAQILVLATLVAFLLTPHPPRPTAPAAPAPQAPSTPPGRWRRLLSAAPALLVTAACVAALLGHALLGMTRDALCHLVGIEFLVIHSFPFLAAITLPRLPWGRWRIFQWFLFVTWSCLYLAFATEGAHGLEGLVGFATGAITTYLGFLLRWGAGNRIGDLAKRWGTSFGFFMIAAVASGARNHQPSDATLWHGALYFAALGLAEACGLHDFEWKRARARLRGRPRSNSRRERARATAGTARR